MSSVEKGERVYRAFDYRIFNSMFTLALSSRAFSTIFRALTEGGVKPQQWTSDPGVCVKWNDDISVVGYGNYYVMMMNERGMRTLQGALKKAHSRWAAEDWMVANLLEKMEQGNRWL